MICGIGIDIITIERIKKACLRMGDTFLTRVFTPGEKAYSQGKKEPFPHLAGMFAAKEAARKAFGERIRGIGWSDIEVIHTNTGQPKLILHRGAEKTAKEIGIRDIHISISHDHPQAIAIVIFES